MQAIKAWAENNMTEVLDARTAYDEHTSSGGQPSVGRGR